MVSSEKNSAANHFERRNNSVENTCYPLTDSDGVTIEKERRLNASFYLGKIKIEETMLQDDEFTKLFKQ